MELIEEHLAAIRLSLGILIWIVIGAMCVIIDLWILGIIIFIIAFIVWLATDVKGNKKKKAEQNKEVV